MMPSLWDGRQIPEEWQDPKSQGQALMLLPPCSEASVSQLMRHRDHLCTLNKSHPLPVQSNILLKNCPDLPCWINHYQVTPVYLCFQVQGSTGIRHLGEFSDSEPPAVTINSNKNQTYKQESKCTTREAPRLMSRKRTFPAVSF